MKKYQLSKTSILRWMFLRTLLFIALYIMFFDILNIHKTLFLKKINIFFIYNIFYVIYVFILPVVKYLSWSYYADENFIELRYGVIYRKIVCVPINRIKYIDLIQDPISRILRIKTIRIYTARGKLTIPSINYKECTKIWNLARNNSFMR